jgi:hypothetical protein
MKKEKKWFKKKWFIILCIIVGIVILYAIFDIFTTYQSNKELEKELTQQGVTCTTEAKRAEQLIINSLNCLMKCPTSSYFSECLDEDCVGSCLMPSTEMQNFKCLRSEKDFEQWLDKRVIDMLKCMDSCASAEECPTKACIQRCASFLK